MTGNCKRINILVKPKYLFYFLPKMEKKLKNRGIGDIIENREKL